MQAIPDSLNRCLQSYGGTVRVSSPVAEILCAGGRVRGVRLVTGEEILARAVVAATPPQVTARLLSGSGVPHLAALEHAPANHAGLGCLVVVMALVKQAVQNVRDLVTALPMPPKAVWLTSASALLPGLAASLYDHSLEGTDVAVLPSEAAAEAAAALDARIRNGLLSAEHHDAMLPANRIIKDVATVHSLSS